MVIGAVRGKLAGRGFTEQGQAGTWVFEVSSPVDFSKDLLM